MTTPTGDPPWVRSADHTIYGGHVGKHDYEQQGVTNPLTDVSAAQFQRLANDLASFAATAHLAVLSIQCHDTVADDPTVSFVHALNGMRSSSYEGDAAPTGFPTAERVSAGSATIQWPATLTDAYGISAAPQIRAAFASCSGYQTTVALVDSRTITVAALDGALAVDDAVIDVWVY